VIRGNVNRRMKRAKNATILPRDGEGKAQELKAETV
jgi:Na+-transporting NADH:ubiquinone oxidoreductase subunit B